MSLDFSGLQKYANHGDVGELFFIPLESGSGAGSTDGGATLTISAGLPFFSGMAPHTPSPDRSDFPMVNVSFNFDAADSGAYVLTGDGGLTVTIDSAAADFQGRSMQLVYDGVHDQYTVTVAMPYAAGFQTVHLGRNDGHNMSGIYAGHFSGGFVPAVPFLGNFSLVSGTLEPGVLMTLSCRSLGLFPDYPVDLAGATVTLSAPSATITYSPTFISDIVHGNNGYVQLLYPTAGDYTGTVNLHLVGGYVYSRPFFLSIHAGAVSPGSSSGGVSYANYVVPKGIAARLLKVN